MNISPLVSPVDTRDGLGHPANSPPSIQQPTTKPTFAMGARRAASAVRLWVARIREPGPFSYLGNGRVSVPVASILGSAKVMQQVAVVRQIERAQS